MTDGSRRQFVRASAALLTVASAGLMPAAIRAAESVWTLPRRRAIDTVENEWITLKDGTRLAMRLWLPSDALQSPVPVVLEYLPYRKRDVSRTSDQAWAQAFAPYGFAFARVDIRGSGDSEGLLLDEYLKQEQDDALEIITWLARAPWCNGKVGMRGYSWGGFNSLQVAARSPPALAAIMVHCATDNRFTDDSHYVGGSLVMDNYDWGAEFHNVMTAAPDPAIVGPGWRDQWLGRLKATSAICAKWLSHQRFDAYWKHGSVALDYSRIRCPVYLVDGQIDAYRDFLPRMLEHLDVPRKGVMGPWGHEYPQLADPGPGLDWVYEEVRWWSHWLYGIDTGIMREPMLRAFVESKTASEVWPRDVPGRWVSDPAWPSPREENTTWFLNPDGLSATPGVQSLLTCRSTETLGLTKREWFPADMNIDLAPDQTPDDRRSLTFDSAPLSESFEILGKPSLRIRVDSDQPVAKLAVRLNEVRPDGTSWCVSYGILNLTHRNGHENPSPLVPGRPYDVHVGCYFTAHRFDKGSRIRVSISESLWPMTWPSPKPVQLHITTGVSSLALPVRRAEKAESPLSIPLIRDRVEHDIAAAPDAMEHARLSQVGPDAAGHVMIHKTLRPPPETLKDIGTVVTSGSDWFMSITEGNPNSSRWRVETFQGLARGDWDTKTSSSVELTSTSTEFHLTEQLSAFESGRLIFERRWTNTIKRDCM